MWRLAMRLAMGRLAATRLPTCSLSSSCRCASASCASTSSASTSRAASSGRVLQHRFCKLRVLQQPALSLWARLPAAGYKIVGAPYSSRRRVCGRVLQQPTSSLRTRLPSSRSQACGRVFKKLRLRQLHFCQLRSTSSAPSKGRVFPATLLQPVRPPAAGVDVGASSGWRRQVCGRTSR